MGDDRDDDRTADAALMRVPGFRIKRTIGRGGMAVAYLAVQESLARNVVLKVMNSTQADGEDFLERFVNEGRIVAALRHPHIITIYDIGRAADLVYIAMEYVEGGDLKSLIGRTVTPERALDILEKVAQALGYAHQQGIIHRDVKPANILFRQDGTVLLSDFGIAKQVTVDSELTSTGTILGSPFYMSPEQAEGQQVDARTDIYSLGVIFYEMLTGERPYQGDSAIKVIMQHIQSPLPELPPELAAMQPLLDSMMAKERGQRVADAQSLIAQIRALRVKLQNAGATAAPPDATQISTRSDRAVAASRGGLRDPKVLALLAVIVAATGAYGMHIFQSLTRPPAFLKRPTEPVDNLAVQGTLQSQAASGAVAAAPPATAPGAVDRESVLQAIEWLARNSLREDRLTQPAADNAYYYYSRLLALDPGNATARDGLHEIAERFVVLAEEAFSRRDYAKAQAYIALGHQVDPENRGLNELQSFIDNRKKTFMETVVDLIRGDGG
ncbi:MAG: serine/threonine protein kinase [Ectothiorhodospiraceae bacterium]|nr:serine/threonine protein kinase [Chromatiales bacterium]MCP5153582.1 serine/threonine protein kinase [Ectothiorhodospiraceae bacterium]